MPFTPIQFDYPNCTFQSGLPSVEPIQHVCSLANEGFVGTGRTRLPVCTEPITFYPLNILDLYALYTAVLKTKKHAFRHFLHFDQNIEQTESIS